MLSVAPILGVNDVQATVDWFVESLGLSMDVVYGGRDFCIETPAGHRIAFESPLDAA
jgi:hypothetical protein